MPCWKELKADFWKGCVVMGCAVRAITASKRRSRVLHTPLGNPLVEPINFHHRVSVTIALAYA